MHEADAGGGALFEIVENRFLRMATHELSNPLASLQAVVNRMAMEPAALTDPDRRADYLTRLRRQVDRMTRLVHDLHDMERLRDGSMRLVRERCDLAELARETCEPLAAEAPKHAILVEEKSAAAGPWDRVRISQVITNLVTNAQRYSPDGGEIRVMSTPGNGTVVRFSFPTADPLAVMLPLDLERAGSAAIA